MNRQKVIEFMKAVGVRPETIRDNGEWINASCPLSQYTHESGKDSKPSFGISVATMKPSTYYCFTCSGGEAKILPSLISRLWILSGEYPYKAAKILIGNETLSEDVNIIESDVWAFSTDKTDSALDFIPKNKLRGFDSLLWGKSVLVNRAKEYLRSRGVFDHIMYESRVMVDQQDGTLVFPLTDIDNRVCMLRKRAFPAKIMWTVTAEKLGIIGKKLPTLKKSGAWFRLHLADFSKPIFMVEGEIDAMRLASLGVHNVIASATSSVTETQINNISSDTLVLGYDDDRAGERAKCRISKISLDSATLIDLKWGYAKKLNGEACNDPGDVPNADQLNVVLQHAKVLTKDIILCYNL